ncbi:MAG: hypothetical protein EOL88_00720 [Bacteroidia bacterium]|nr:hypothetical protein [Bacteroidia bacterium]
MTQEFKTIKIYSEYMSKYPIWGIYNQEGERIDFYDRQSKEFKNGLSREQLVKILKKKNIK